MKINATMGASTYALKKAMETPQTLLKLIQNPEGSTAKSPETTALATTPTDPSSATSKGSIIDVIV